MQNTKINIEYDGTRYNGWQRLGDTDNTIQAKIESVLSVMSGESVNLIGSGRTDAGVHALNQVAHFKTDKNFVSQSIIDYCYKYLPKDIVVKSAEVVDDRFHARYNIVKKQYLYIIDNNPIHSVFSRKYQYHIPEVLSITKMNQSAGVLVGKMDYRSFTNLKSKNKNTIKTIYDINISKEEGIIKILFTGDGFLYNMVRIITSCLIESGLGTITPDDMKAILSGKSRQLAPGIAPPHGLYLFNSIYKT